MKYLLLTITWEEKDAFRSKTGIDEVACSYNMVPTNRQLSEFADSRQKFPGRWVKGFTTKSIEESEFDSKPSNYQHNFG